MHAQMLCCGAMFGGGDCMCTCGCRWCPLPLRCVCYAAHEACLALERLPATGLRPWAIHKPRRPSPGINAWLSKA